MPINGVSCCETPTRVEFDARKKRFVPTAAHKLWLLLQRLRRRAAPRNFAPFSSPRPSPPPPLARKRVVSLDAISPTICRFVLEQGEGRWLGDTSQSYCPYRTDYALWDRRLCSGSVPTISARWRTNARMPSSSQLSGNS